MRSGGEAEGVWEKLRGTRWDPPAAASAVEARRRTYVFALEQAEQMFRAAAEVGVATRPLLVFYGLSQAGRAIAAAAAHASGDGWELEGHGIRCIPATLRGPLPSIEIQTDAVGRKGSFARLSELLGSPLWPKPDSITLGALWDSLPESRLSPLDDTGPARRTPLLVDHQFVDPEPHPLVSVTVAYFPPWVVSAGDGRKALDSYLKAFPDAPPCHSYYLLGHERDSAPNFSRHVDGWGDLAMNWELPPDSTGSLEEKLRYLQAMTRPYDGQWWLLPAADPVSRSLHPLMAWWAVLYTLSMLARYQPAEWAAHINIDSSRHAVAVESLLKRAISTVPALIAEAISHAADPDQPPPATGNDQAQIARAGSRTATDPAAQQVRDIS